MSQNVFATDRATSALIRRVLCPQHLHTSESSSATFQLRPGARTQQFNRDAITTASNNEPLPVSEILPPLTSSNTVDLQLYALLAILIKDFVHPWYGKITNDTHFVEEVVRVVAHVTRAIESRARDITQVEWENCLLGDFGLAGSLSTHVDACLVANKAVISHSQQLRARGVYHSLRPHPALQPVPESGNPQAIRDQENNDAAYRRVLAQGFLAVLLPTEDLLNPCLRALISEAVADLVLGKFAGTVFCEPSFVFDSLATAMNTLRARQGIPEWTIHRVQDSASPFNSSERQRASGQYSVLGVYSLLVQYLTLATTVTRGILAAVAMSSGLPKRITTTTMRRRISKDSAAEYGDKSEERQAYEEDVRVQPLVSYHIWTTTAKMFSLAVIMPWLYGLFSLIHWIGVNGRGIFCGTDTRFDRLLSHYLTAPFKDPELLPAVLLNLRVNLFPGNTVPKAPSPQPSAVSSTGAGAGVAHLVPPQSPSPSTPANPSPLSTVSSSAQLLETKKHEDDSIPVAKAPPPSIPPDDLSPRRKAALALLNLIPQSLARLYLLGSAWSSNNDDIERMLDSIEKNVLYIFDDAYMNKHLIYSALEIVVAMILPELGDANIVAKLRGRDFVENEEVGLRVTELLRRRGVDIDGDGV